MAVLLFAYQPPGNVARAAAELRASMQGSSYAALPPGDEGAPRLLRLQSGNALPNQPVVVTPGPKALDAAKAQFEPYNRALHQEVRRVWGTYKLAHSVTWLGMGAAVFSAFGGLAAAAVVSFLGVGIAGLIVRRGMTSGFERTKRLLDTRAGQIAKACGLRAMESRKLVTPLATLVVGSDMEGVDAWLELN